MRTGGIITISAAWVICGVVAFGFVNAEAQRKWSHLCQTPEHLGTMIGYGILGPAGLVYATFNRSRYGWMLGYEAEDCRQAAARTCPLGHILIYPGKNGRLIDCVRLIPHRESR